MTLTTRYGTSRTRHWTTVGQHLVARWERYASATGGALYALSAASLARRSGLRKMRVRVPKGEVACYVARESSKPVLVLLHGLTGDKRIWLRCSVSLTRTFRLVIPDLAGHGENPFCADDDYGAPAHALIVAQLLSLLGVTRYHVAGNSLGGWVACELALREPASVMSLILFSPAGMRAHRASWFDDRVDSGNNPLMIETGPQFREFYAALMHHAPPLPAFVALAMAHDYKQGRARVERLFHDYVAAPSLHGRLDAIRCPSSIVWGREDRIIDISALQDWSTELSDADIDTWSGVGHMPMLEVPAQASAHISTFISQAHPDRSAMQRDCVLAREHAMPLVETTIEALSSPLGALIRGELTAILVKGALAPAHCERVRENFDSSPGIYRRGDGVSARMVGSHAYLKTPGAVLEAYRKHNADAELLFSGVTNTYRQLYDRVEDAGYRFRPAYIDGVPAPTHRASMWDEGHDPGVLLKAHTDWPQVRNSGMEFQDVLHPIAVNLYASHPPVGTSWVRIYDFIPSHSWLSARGIARGGYPISMAELAGVSFSDIHPEQGDILLFAASNVHAVFSAPTAESTQRLNVNGFIGYSRTEGRVLAWA